MSDVLADNTTKLLRGAGRHWGWPLAYGIITLLLGVVVLAWPDRTIKVVAILFGIQLLVAGVFYFVSAIAADGEGGGTRVLLALLGVLSFIAGLYALRHLLVTIAALAVILGIFWIVNGAIEVFTALTDSRMHGRGWTVLMGLLSVAAGIVVLVWPGISLLTLAVVLGVWLLVLGVMEIVFAFQLRSAGRTVGQMAPAT
ncbi:DUF308 domain-containing protein [Kribbella sp. NBC_01484]|uniref:HdeD family acid-resistance protein n=1 Tax=Kribbella sp. NBC_01484 TaxID=2903579 RepID=UPI002E37970A|nr:DUF308 domain-containing protein [Kribbella sp. NBC_01484]